MRLVRVVCALSAVGVMLAAGGARAASVIDVGHFQGASEGLFGCFSPDFEVSPTGGYSYCFLAYTVGKPGDSPVRLLGWEFYGSQPDASAVQAQPQRWAEGAIGAPVDRIDLVEPATALQAINGGMQLSADVPDPDFGNVSVFLAGFSGLTTSSAQVSESGTPLPNLWVRTPGSNIDESPCLSGCHQVASAAKAPDLIGSGWFWTTVSASGGWDFTPGEIPSVAATR